MRKALSEESSGSAFPKALWLVGSVLFALGLSPHTFAVESQNEVLEDVIEEVLVTGSYLKRSAADSPSPLAPILVQLTNQFCGSLRS